jgi:Class II flagellar assembly regulator
MKVGSTQKAAPSRGTAKSAGSNSSSATFSPDMSPVSSSAGSNVASISSLTSITSLLAVQGVAAPDNALTGKKRAMVTAEETLDILDEIKLGLLAGEVPTTQLDGLLERVETERSGIDDPELENLLDHIELRARVELAKYGR